ncbi:hypothetical protein [Rhizorhabdus wittichii]|uniref:hypothetical protein n=1 Tax=Rhizorhabdus wittichii TaxID=160791 RepID=UPI0012FDBFB1|nr:hypothetical protein [Rhizorhabdus wittichii]
MSRDEQARALLAAEYERDGHVDFASEVRSGNINRTGMGAAIRAIIEALRGASGGGVERPPDAPINIVLHCPNCGLQHIDEPVGEWEGRPWANPPHRSHLCHGCGCIWRPADIATNGVSSIETRGKADTWPADGEHAFESIGLIAGEAERRLSGACTVTASADHAASACSSDGSATPDHPAENAKSSGEVDRWQPIETEPAAGTVILRPHIHYGPMAVKRPNPDAMLILAAGCEWVTVDYATCWPEGAFLPLWMPRPDAPAALARSGKGEG